MNTVYKILIPFLLSIATTHVNAAMVNYTLTGNTVEFTANKGTLKFDFTSPAVSRVAVGDDKGSDKKGPVQQQSYNAISDAIESVFTLTPGTLVTPTGTNYQNDISGSSASFTSDIAYKYLAVHFGGYEVFFEFLNPVAVGTKFSIDNVSATRAGGLSNYRAYQTDKTIAVVPAPEVALAFAPALIGFTIFRRKNNLKGRNNPEKSAL
jgi:hypothetical protein